MFTKEEIKLMDSAFSYYDETYTISRDGNVYMIDDLFKVNSLPGKIDDNGMVVPIGE